MRSSFSVWLERKLDEDPNIYFLTADLGFGVFDHLMRKYPDRCINIGVAEQNMMLIAGGLASQGKKVFVYSIGSFALMRGFEMLRSGLAYNSLGIFVLANGGGFSYGPLGYTHHMLEDLALVSALRNAKYISASTVSVWVSQLDEFLKYPRLTFARLDHLDVGRTNVSNIPRLVTADSEKSVWLEHGPHQPPLHIKHRILVLSLGTIDRKGERIAEKLRGLGAFVSHYSLQYFSEFDVPSIQWEGVDLLVTLEEHNMACGLGERVNSVLFKRLHSGLPTLNLAVRDIDVSIFGSRDFLIDQFIGSDELCVRQIKELLSWSV